VRWLSRLPSFNTVLLSCFLLAWLWTEIVESIDRDKKWDYIEGFVTKGDRFTAEDGDELKARVSRLEQQLEEE
jgi:hypothetical protein